MQIGRTQQEDVSNDSDDSDDRPGGKYYKQCHR